MPKNLPDNQKLYCMFRQNTLHIGSQGSYKGKTGGSKCFTCSLVYQLIRASCCGGNNNLKVVTESKLVQSWRVCGHEA